VCCDKPSFRQCHDAGVIQSGPGIQIKPIDRNDMDPLVLDGAAGGESGKSVSLLSRTPKARASRQFLECERAFGEPFLNHSLMLFYRGTSEIGFGVRVWLRISSLFEPENGRSSV
jgi:hypothetical protein